MIESEALKKYSSHHLSTGIPVSKQLCSQHARVLASLLHTAAEMHSVDKFNLNSFSEVCCAADSDATEKIVNLSCFDDNDECVEWASGGECVKNPVFMSTNCRESCKLCEPYIQVRPL